MPKETDLHPPMGIPVLDALRGLAAVMVQLYHALLIHGELQAP